MEPRQMKAVVLRGPNQFAVETVPVPEPGPEEVLCRIRAVAICGSDPEIFRGDLIGTWPPSVPFIPGHEWAGEVVAVGPQVTAFRIGDRAAGEAHKGCGFCEMCKSGRYNLCCNYGKPETGHRHYGFIVPGAYAEYNVYSVRAITKLPENITFAEGAMVDTAGVALHGVHLSGITLGGAVAVVGPGPIGLTTMMLARIMGASTVIAIGRPPRIESARLAGADVLINNKVEDPVARVMEVTNGHGVDEAFECSGTVDGAQTAVATVRKGGKVVLLGVPDGKTRLDLPMKHVVHNEIAIFGSRANPNVSQEVVSLMASGKLDVKPLITHRFSLDQFGTALDTFVKRSDGAMKVVVEP